jgi:hypothetical protein
MPSDSQHDREAKQHSARHHEGHHTNMPLEIGERIEAL